VKLFETATNCCNRCYCYCQWISV